MPGVFEEVTNALYRNEWLEVDYSNVEGKRTLGNVMPLAIAQQGPRLYLVCRFEDYDNERNLALHHMVAARRLDRTFMRPNDFDLAQYDGDGRFGFGDGHRIHLSFFTTHDLACIWQSVRCPAIKSSPTPETGSKLPPQWWTPCSSIVGY